MLKKTIGEDFLRRQAESFNLARPYTREGHINDLDLQFNNYIINSVTNNTAQCQRLQLGASQSIESIQYMAWCLTLLIMY